MLNRRKFLQYTAFTSAMLSVKNSAAAALLPTKSTLVANLPVVISTWDFGIAANQAAWKILSIGGRALDAVEQGVWVPEADVKNQTVGYGGLPDRDGRVTLDACIMDEFGNCGSVAALEHIMHPISVARKVMENTPHVMLAGDGALQFALENGFKKNQPINPGSRKSMERVARYCKIQPRHEY
ncbi:isoaspartyl peptidase/L-asparaginase [Pedobacter antarcticus]|uniref:isoaspartyl peptidase/L-asparaginase n=1 Tax=Pedobacter antarcticus TaxID=34086 RepID=UPI000A81E690|nr:isoaspartyl peptidase/L-asparaginase [Pedobacter antarcticus]